MDWDKLKIFHAVAEAGSFTNATINLNLKSISNQQTNTIFRTRFKSSTI